MAMTIAEMELHHAAYDSLVEQAQSALREKRYYEAVQLAISAGEHIDGMIQYETKRVSAQISRIYGMEIVLRYAPLLLDLRSLDQLGQLLAQCRRIEKNVSTDYKQALAGARIRLWQCHRLWDLLETTSESRQDEVRQLLGGDQEEWRRIAGEWETMGLLRRSRDGGTCRLSLMTMMDEPVKAKCPSCGALAEGAKVQFLERICCSTCREPVLFVMLPQ